MYSPVVHWKAFHFYKEINQHWE